MPIQNPFNDEDIINKIVRQTKERLKSDPKTKYLASKFELTPQTTFHIKERDDLLMLNAFLSVIKGRDMKYKKTKNSIENNCYFGFVDKLLKFGFELGVFASKDVTLKPEQNVVEYPGLYSIEAPKDLTFAYELRGGYFAPSNEYNLMSFLNTAISDLDSQIEVFEDKMDPKKIIVKATSHQKQKFTIKKGEQLLNSYGNNYRETLKDKGIDLIPLNKFDNNKTLEEEFGGVLRSKYKKFNQLDIDTQNFIKSSFNKYRHKDKLLETLDNIYFPEIMIKMINNENLDDCVNQIEFPILYKRGVYPLSRDEQIEMTPLMFACLNGKMDAVQFLIKNGAMINRGDYNLRTAIFYLIENGDFKLIDTFFDYAQTFNNLIDITLQDKDRQTIFHDCFEKANVDMFLKLLLKVGTEKFYSDRLSALESFETMTKGIETMLKSMSHLQNDNKGSDVKNVGNDKVNVTPGENLLKRNFEDITPSQGNETNSQTELYTDQIKKKKKIKEENDIKNNFAYVTENFMFKFNDMEVRQNEYHNELDNQFEFLNQLKSDYENNKSIFTKVISNMANKIYLAKLEVEGNLDKEKSKYKNLKNQLESLSEIVIKEKNDFSNFEKQTLISFDMIEKNQKNQSMSINDCMSQFIALKTQNVLNNNAWSEMITNQAKKLEQERLEKEGLKKTIKHLVQQQNVMAADFNQYKRETQLEISGLKEKNQKNEEENKNILANKFDEITSVQNNSNQQMKMNQYLLEELKNQSLEFKQSLSSVNESLLTECAEREKMKKQHENDMTRCLNIMKNQFSSDLNQYKEETQLKISSLEEKILEKDEENKKLLIQIEEVKNLQNQSYLQMTNSAIGFDQQLINCKEDISILKENSQTKHMESEKMKNDIGALIQEKRSKDYARTMHLFNEMKKYIDQRSNNFTAPLNIQSNIHIPNLSKASSNLHNMQQTQAMSNMIEINNRDNKNNHFNQMGQGVYAGNQGLQSQPPTNYVNQSGQSQLPMNYANQAVQQPQQAMNYANPMVQQPQQAMNYANQVVQQPQQVMNYANPMVQQPQQAMNYANPMVQQPQQAMNYANPMVQQPQQPMYYAHQMVQPSQQQMNHANQMVQPPQHQMNNTNQMVQPSQSQMNHANRMVQSSQQQMNHANQKIQAVQHTNNYQPTLFPQQNEKGRSNMPSTSMEDTAVSELEEFMNLKTNDDDWDILFSTSNL
ncbi:MAG: hypothetical protein HKM04_03985 [Legionellales bacterium]|nr:hypothetical protein [Legionellales bacterium]